MIKTIEQLYGRIYSVARKFGKITVAERILNNEKLTCVYVSGRCDEAKLHRAAFGQVVDRQKNGRIRIAVVVK